MKDKKKKEEAKPRVSPIIMSSIIKSSKLSFHVLLPKIYVVVEQQIPSFGQNKFLLFGILPKDYMSIKKYCYMQNAFKS